MKRALSLAFIAFLLFSMLTAVNAQQVQKLSIDQLEAILSDTGGKTLVVNFWATWCKPCIEELPCFEALHQSGKEAGTEVLLVSVDFANQHESKLLPFVQRRKIGAPVAHLMETDPNAWIDRVSEQWQGDIPAILVVNSHRKLYHFEAKAFHNCQELTDFLSALQ